LIQRVPRCGARDCIQTSVAVRIDREDATFLMPMSGALPLLMLAALMMHEAAATAMVQDWWDFVDPINLVNRSAAGDVKAVVSIINKSPDESAKRRLITEATNDKGVPALTAAAASGHADIVRELLAALRGAAAKIHAIGRAEPTDGNTSLMVAADKGHVGVVVKLLIALEEGDAKNQNIEMQNSKGMTALMSAAFHGHVGVVRKLLYNQNRATKKYLIIEQLNDEDESALMLAAKAGHVAVVGEFLGEAEQTQVIEALTLAASNRHWRVVAQLLPVLEQEERERQVIEMGAASGAIALVAAKSMGMGPQVVTEVLDRALHEGPEAL